MNSLRQSTTLPKNRRGKTYRLDVEHLTQSRSHALRYGVHTSLEFPRFSVISHSPTVETTVKFSYISLDSSQNRRLWLR